MKKYFAREHAIAGSEWIILEAERGEFARFRVDLPDGFAAWQDAVAGIARAGGNVFLARRDGTGGYIAGNVGEIDN